MTDLADLAIDEAWRALRRRWERKEALKGWGQMSFLLVANSSSVVGHYPELVDALIERFSRTDQMSVVEVIDPPIPLATVDWGERPEAKPGTKLFMSKGGRWSEDGTSEYFVKTGIYVGSNKVLEIR